LARLGAPPIALIASGPLGARRQAAAASSAPAQASETRIRIRIINGNSRLGAE
jgi:hypothetical protein